MIIDQLPAAASVDLTDELPIEKGQVTYKATVSQIADKATANLAYEYHNYTAYSVGDYVIHEGVLYKCTTDILVGEDFDPDKWAQVALANEVEGLNTAILQSAAYAITANGTSAWNTLTGLTADHVIGNWGMFTDSTLATPFPENGPPADITIETDTNRWRYTIANIMLNFYFRPTFILKQN